MISAGAAAIEITPSFPVELGGYQSRRNYQKADQAKEPLTANGLILEYPKSGQRVVIISYDLIWLSNSFCYEITEQIKNLFDDQPTHILCCATHTHSGPQLLERAAFYGNPDQRYIAYLKEQTMKLVTEATRFVQPAVLDHTRSRTFWERAVKRTKISRSLFSLKQKVIHSPNPYHTPAQDFNLMTIKNEKNHLLCIVVSMAAHPIFHKDNRFSPDYPGAIRKELQKQCNFNGPILFLQGFAGDIRPNYPSRHFKEHLEQFINTGTLQSGFAKDIANKLPDFAHSAVQNILSETSSPLPYTNQKSSALQYISETIHPWKSSSEAGDHELITISRTDIFRNLSLCTINAEVFSGYASTLRNIERKTGRVIIPVGYTNGMLGYLPTKKILELKSGYEYNSWHKFGLPAPYRVEIAAQIKEAMYRLFES